MDNKHPAPDVRDLSEAAYRRAKTDAIAAIVRDGIRQRDARDLAAITSKENCPISPINQEIT